MWGRTSTPAPAPAATMRCNWGALAPLLLALPALADIDDDMAKAVVRATDGPACAFAKRDRFDLPAPDESPEKRILWLFHCPPERFLGTRVLVLDGGWGAERVTLARPFVKMIDARPQVLGWTTTGLAENPRFDAQTLTLRTWEQVSGNGDLSETGRHALTRDGFMLVHYAVDMTLNDGINPVTVYEAP